jgi:dihydrofolate reductase
MPRPSAPKVLRPLRYQVAVSLDGFIAGPKGEFDWIPMDPDIDFAALFGRFDALVMGRKTWEAVTAMHGGGGSGGAFGMETYVVSTKLAAKPPKGVTVIDHDVAKQIAALKSAKPSAPGKELWLHGGGQLFASLLDAGLVDTVELAVIPIVLGGGIPVVAATKKRHALKLKEQRVYPKTGTALMTYAVEK